MVREADDYLAKVGTRFAAGPAAEETAKELREEPPCGRAPRPATI